MRPLFLFVAVAHATFIAISVRHVCAADQKIIGTNLSGLGSITTQWDFIDLMKGSNPWQLVGGGDPMLDALGNPILTANQETWTLPRLKIDNASQLRTPDFPAGIYSVMWEGSGSFFLTGDGSFKNFISVGVGGGLETFSAATGHDQLYLEIESSSPVDPIRNIQLLMPGYSPGDALNGEKFHQVMLDRAEPFGAIRFMDWMRANSSRIEQWSDRTLPDANQFTMPDGVPVEAMVDLSNLLHADAWFTMPVRADDDYVWQFATYVRDNLDPSTNIYVEYGNEVWALTVSGNTAPGWEYFQEQLRDESNPWYDPSLGPDDTNQNWYKQWAVEVNRDFHVWMDVFQGQQDRIIRVAAAQGANRFHTPRYFDEMYDGGVRQFDAISLSAYIGNQSVFDASTTADDIIDNLFGSLDEMMDSSTEIFFPGTGIEVMLPRGDWVWHKQMADQHGVPLITYEGGQHLTPNGDQNVAWYDAYVAAQHDPRMYDVYTTLLDTYLNDLGADGFMNFSFVSEINLFGAWGVLEFADQDPAHAPKYRALLDFLGDLDLGPAPNGMAQLGSFGQTYTQDFDALGTASTSPGTLLPIGWSTNNAGIINTETTIRFPSASVPTGTYNAGVDTDRTLATGNTVREAVNAIQFWGGLTGTGDVLAVVLESRIEASHGDLITQADDPGEAAFVLSLEFDAEKDGTFTTAHTFNGGNPVTTGLVLSPDSLDGNGAAGTSFVSGLVELSAPIPAASNIRLTFDAQGVGQTQGYIFGVDDVMFRIVAPGDGDGNGEVNSTDLFTILAAAKFNNPAFGPATWAEGDYNGDDLVNSADLFLILAAAKFNAGPYTTTTPPATLATVPEPSGFILAALGLVGLLAFAWCRMSPMPARRV